MRGRWAAGIVPRNFAWIIQDRLAVSERPGGHAPSHRRVRRQEEIIWLKAQGFDRVISLIPSTHNLHAYEERELASAHFPLPLHGDAHATLDALYPALLGWLRSSERILVHQDELGERVSGVIAGFLCWCGVLPEQPRAVSAVEQLLKRQMGSAGRSIVAIVPELKPPALGMSLTVPPGQPTETAAGDGTEKPAEAASPPTVTLVEGGASSRTRQRPRP